MKAFRTIYSGSKKKRRLIILNRETMTTQHPLHGTLPWTKSCFVCGESNPHGLRLRSHVDGKWIWLKYTPREADLGYRQIVHGGLTGTLLDEVMTWAAILAARRMCVAAEFNTRLIRPIGLGMMLTFRGQVTRFTSRLILTEGEVHDANGTVLSTATGKYIPMQADQVPLNEDDFVHSPEAIPLATLLGQ